MTAPLLTLDGVHTHIGAYHILHGVDLAVPANQLSPKIRDYFRRSDTAAVSWNVDESATVAQKTTARGTRDTRSQPSA